MERIHATCVAVNGHGVLLKGPSGSGKSDLALRLIEGGARLVSDDYTQIEVRGDYLLASAPETIRGLLEVRGLGILRLQPIASASLAAVISLVPSAEMPRMPEGGQINMFGITLPAFKLAAFEASAAAKVRLAVLLATGGIMHIP